VGARNALRRDVDARGSEGGPMRVFAVGRACGVRRCDARVSEDAARLYIGVKWVAKAVGNV
jgi:hypothetical protein